MSLMTARTALVVMVRLARFEKAPKTGRAIPDMINELYGNKCTLNDPEAAQQAQSEYERIITEMHTHLLELIPAHPHLILDSAQSTTHE